MSDVDDCERITEVITLVDNLQKKCDNLDNWDELNIAIHPDNWIYKDNLVVGLTYVRSASCTKHHTHNWLNARQRLKELCIKQGENVDEMMTGLYSQGEGD